MTRKQTLRDRIIAAMRYHERSPNPYQVRWEGKRFSGTEPQEVVDRVMAYLSGVASTPQSHPDTTTETP